jgi:hypothetical protein
MAFAKSKLDFFYATGADSQLPNLIALKDIMSTGAKPTPIFPKGTLFFTPIKEGGGNTIKVMGSEVIILGENARFITDEEIVTFKAKELLKVGTNVAQEIGDKALNEEGLVRKSNIAWWLLGGLVVYLVVFKK